jgi:hypothetical protein
MKIKLSGSAAQTNGLVSPGMLLTLSILTLNSVPIPFNGVKSLEKADMRRVFIVPGPLPKTLPDTFQLTAVSPAGCVGPGETVRKVSTAESKVKSPWKPP